MQILGSYFKRGKGGTMKYILNYNVDEKLEFDIGTRETRNDEAYQCRLANFWQAFKDIEKKGFEFKYQINSSEAHEFFDDEIIFRCRMKTLRAKRIGFFPLIKYQPQHWVTPNVYKKLQKAN